MSSLDLCLMMSLPYFFNDNFAYNYHFFLLQRFLKNKILYICIYSGSVLKNRVTNDRKHVEIFELFYVVISNFCMCLSAEFPKKEIFYFCNFLPFFNTYFTLYLLLTGHFF